MRKMMLALSLVVFISIGCSHNMRITNLNDNFSPPVAPPKETIKIGIRSADDSDMEKSRYISSVVEAVRRSGSFEKIIYPYDHSRHNGDVDAIIDLSVSPRYSGEGSNFFVNFPGFLIFAPAIWGYGYNAKIDTVANISFSGKDISQQISIPTKYKFRQSEIDRTWTEVGWLEFGIIPLIGGIAFTQYDPDVTDEFITKVSPNYGACVAKKIAEAIYSN